MHFNGFHFSKGNSFSRPFLCFFFFFLTPLSMEPGPGFLCNGIFNVERHFYEVGTWGNATISAGRGTRWDCNYKKVCVCICECAKIWALCQVGLIKIPELWCLARGPGPSWNHRPLTWSPSAPPNQIRRVLCNLRCAVRLLTRSRLCSPGYHRRCNSIPPDTRFQKWFSCFVDTLLLAQNFSICLVKASGPCDCWRYCFI